MHVPDSDSEDELPPGWEERVTVDGSVFYANHVTRNTQWTHPRTGVKKCVSGELPYGWERCVDKNSGKVIYVDHDNKRTTYTDPRLAFAVEEKDSIHDYRQRFDASSTALQVLHGRDLNNKICLITGANTGIGFETARSFAKHGCTVILACRNMKSTKEAIENIIEEKPEAKDKLFSIHLDLTSLASVRKACHEVKTSFSRLDILILNAGVYGLPYSLTDDGFETVFQVNHLAQFYLTLLLRTMLVSGSRVVIVSSESHRFSNLTADTISPTRLSCDNPSKYWSMATYNDSKLCNVLFAREVAFRLQRASVAAFSLHPGNMVSSSLARHWWIYRLAFFIVRPFTKSLQQAAATTAYCATAPELRDVTGIYCNNCYRCEPAAIVSDAHAQDGGRAASSLWKVSMEMLRDAFGRWANGAEVLEELSTLEEKF